MSAEAFKNQVFLPGGPWEREGSLWGATHAGRRGGRVKL